MKKERIQKLKKTLAQKGIEYEQDYSQEEISIGEYPKDIRISVSDLDYTVLNYPHTGKFYYVVSWIDWNKSNCPKIRHAEQLTNAMKIIKNAMYEIGISNNVIQEILFF